MEKGACRVGGMKTTIRLVRFNPVVGDVRGNGERVAEAAREAARDGVGVAVFPEMALSGYPTGDLVQRGAFMAAVDAELLRLKEELPPEVGVVLGTPLRVKEGRCNAVVVFEGGQMRVVDQKESIAVGGIRIGFAESDAWGQGWAEGNGGWEEKGTEGGLADVLLRLEARVYLRGHEGEGDSQN